MSETTTLGPIAEPIKVEFYLDHSNIVRPQDIDGPAKGEPMPKPKM